MHGAEKPDRLIVDFDRYMAARAWMDAAELFHPEKLATWYFGYLDEPEPPVQITPAMVRRHDPDMPEEVARYLADAHNKRAGEHRQAWLQLEFAGVASRSELRSMTAVEGMARRLEAHDPRYSMRRQLERAGASAEKIAEALGAALSLRYRATGAILVSPERANVVFERVWQAAGGPANADAPRVHAAVLHRDRWFLEPDGALLDRNWAYVMSSADPDHSGEFQG